MDRDHVWQVAAPVLPAAARQALLVGLSQLGNQRLAQFPPGCGVDRRVDGLMAHLRLGLVGVHAAQSARDLFRRPAIVQLLDDRRTQRCAFGQFARPTTAACAGNLRRTSRVIADRRCSVSRPCLRRHLCNTSADFTRHRRGRAIEQAGNCPLAQSLIQSTLDRVSFF
jgi:hypothetical protein